MEPAPEAIEQCEVPAVAHGIAVEMQRRGQLQPDDWGHPGREVDRQCAQIGALCTLDPGWADTNLPGDLPDAEAGGEPRIGELIGDPMPEQPTTLRTECRDALAACHRDSLRDGSHRVLIRPWVACESLVEGVPAEQG